MTKPDFRPVRRPLGAQCLFSLWFRKLPSNNDDSHVRPFPHIIFFDDKRKIANENELIQSRYVFSLRSL